MWKASPVSGPNHAPPGWYGDPGGTPYWRRWDGTQWRELGDPFFPTDNGVERIRQLRRLRRVLFVGIPCFVLSLSAFCQSWYVIEHPHTSTQIAVAAPLLVLGLVGLVVANELFVDTLGDDVASGIVDHVPVIGTLKATFVMERDATLGGASGALTMVATALLLLGNLWSNHHTEALILRSGMVAVGGYVLFTQFLAAFRYLSLVRTTPRAD